MTFYRKIYPSPIGALQLIATDLGLAAVLWEGEDGSRVRLGPFVDAPEHPLLIETARQLDLYFQARLVAFDLPLDLQGTEFQKSVWQALLEIPLGETRSYGEIARRLGRPKAFRAVGAANGRNPISIVAACHRVLGSNGKLTGFAGGLPAKAFLLRLEGASSGSFYATAQASESPQHRDRKGNASHRILRSRGTARGRHAGAAKATPCRGR